MRSRTLLFLSIAIGFLFLGIALFAFATRNQEATQVYSATVNRDCAPWDGAAFTISLPIQGSVIDISIYRSPHLKYPVAFSFPDETMQDGNALLLAVGSSEQLTGRVWFESVDQNKPVKGRFDLTAAGGEHFEGSFVADWENEAVYCG